MSKSYEKNLNLRKNGKLNLNLCKEHQKGYKKTKTPAANGWIPGTHSTQNTPAARLRTFLFENGHQRDFFVVIFKSQKEAK